MISSRRWTLLEMIPGRGPSYIVANGPDLDDDEGNDGLEVVPAAALAEALDALKTTDSWLWNKVVHDCYGPAGADDAVADEQRVQR